MSIEISSTNRTCPYDRCQLDAMRDIERAKKDFKETIETEVEKECCDKNDAVSHPSHYTDGRKYEPIDVIDDWGLNFNLGNTVKYISRAGRKGSPDKLQEDLEKAKFYLEYEVKHLKSLRGPV